MDTFSYQNIDQVSEDQGGHSNSKWTSSLRNMLLGVIGCALLLGILSASSSTGASTQLIGEMSLPNTVDPIKAGLREGEFHGDNNPLPISKEPELTNAVFIGHKNCDTDSLVSAISAAYLYSGRAARCEQDLNRETVFVLEHFNIPVPPKTTDPAFQTPTTQWALVDHADVSLVPEGVNQSNIIMVIDHHWLSATTVAITKPIFVDMRPWGSCSTIVAYKYFEDNSNVPHELAGLLMAAILSDTMNLRSSTTRPEDKIAVEFLKKYAGIDDTDALALQMFKAKSDTTGLSTEQIIELDFKTFSMEDTTQLGFGNGNTVEPQNYIDNKEAFCASLEAVRLKRKLDVAFLAVTDMMSMTSLLFTCRDQERAIAAQAYGGDLVHGGMLMDVGARVSRKADFLPPLAAVFTK